MKNSKRALHYRTKIKLGFGLVFIMILLIVAKKFEENNLAEIDQSFVSIYEDRLVPATSIFDMQENLYRKHEILQKALSSNQQDKSLPTQHIAACNHNMNSLLATYKKTYFLDEETNYLQRYEKDLARYNALEAEALIKLEQGHQEGALALFEEQMADPFDDAILQLSSLNHLQMEAGKDLVAGEKVAGASLKMLFRLESGLILLIGLLFYLLVQQPAIAKSESIDRYHLN